MFIFILLNIHIPLDLQIRFSSQWLNFTVGLWDRFLESQIFFFGLHNLSLTHFCFCLWVLLLKHNNHCLFLTNTQYLLIYYYYYVLE